MEIEFIIHRTLDHIIAVSIPDKLNIFRMAMKVTILGDFCGLDTRRVLADEVVGEGSRVLVFAQKCDVLSKGSH